MNKLLDKVRKLGQAPFSESELRLWGVFLTARIALAVLLIVISVVLYSVAQDGVLRGVSILKLLIMGGYLIETLMMRWLMYNNQKQVQQQRLVLWLLTLGLDLIVFSWIYLTSNDSGNYPLLFTFCILMAAALGPRWLIYTVLGEIIFCILVQNGAISQPEAFFSQNNLGIFITSSITFLGFFVIGELTFMLSARMRKEEIRASRGLASAKQQEIINRMIVAEMSVGVIVADQGGRLMMMNPAAMALITGESPVEEEDALSDLLLQEPGWKQLKEVVKTLFEGEEIGNRLLAFDLLLQQGRQGAEILLQIKGRVLEGPIEDDRFCILFMTDMRDVDRRLQQEKLAAMGRVSASIAHEIRNPLATIVSANSLLSEGMHDVSNKHLTQMIAANAQRLSKIIHDVLDVAHLQNSGEAAEIDLLTILPNIVEHWIFSHQPKERIKIFWPDDPFGIFIVFDEDHLRRVIDNLLDNAMRYASDQEGAILIACQTYHAGDTEMVRISVFSDGDELNERIKNSLFEPFFSTEARGTGLGLYICRNLCNRYNASLDYQRTELDDGEKGMRRYNEFFITANRVDALPGETRILIENSRNG